MKHQYRTSSQLERWSSASVSYLLSYNSFKIVAHRYCYLNGKCFQCKCIAINKAVVTSIERKKYFKTSEGELNPFTSCTQ